MHQLLHLFPDIQRKGTADYLHCILGENYHQDLKDAYSASNKKDVAIQLIRQVKRLELFSRINRRIETYHRISTMEAEAIDEGDSSDERDDSEPGDEPPIKKYAFSFFILIGIENGRNRLMTSREIERKLGFFSGVQGKQMFRGFHSKLLGFIDTAFVNCSGEDDNDWEGASTTEVPITVYRTIKHSYVSMDDFLPKQDLIRCSPKFFNRPRFDTVLVDTIHGTRPARLHLILETTRHRLEWQLAYVTYFSLYEPASPLDKLIGMQRFQEEEDGEFIALESIIRSAYMAPYSTRPNDFYFNYNIAADTDMYLRAQQMLS
ncbi:hypothetical protein FRB91_000220 [Serendipita sp. 411]|nr:hypothetical protein FRC18_004868 [Serendipita sp. 400]KAG8847082.1 hypothetical protein FRB91_000220 [Serendipita sp. 411]